MKIFTSLQYRGCKPTSGEYIISLFRNPGIFDKYIMGVDASLIKVRGDCTVWHYFPSGERCPTSLECWLVELWQRAKWREQ